MEKKEGEKKAGITDAKKERPAGKYEVRFGLFPAEGSVKGVCTVTIGGEFAVRNTGYLVRHEIHGALDHRDGRPGFL